MRSLPSALLLLLGCGPAGGSVAQVASDLDAVGRIASPRQPSHWRALLEDNLRKDSYQCLPPVAQVLGEPSGPLLERRIHGSVPHYGWFYGPMVYRVGVVDGMWRVSLHVALTPSGADVIELPDCQTDVRHVVCEGTAYQDDPGVDACPESGRFQAPASRAHLRALLTRWSTEAEGYYNRDARHFGLPVRYDFELSLADEPANAPIDVRMPLWLSCGRTPYFSAFRSGWSIPVVAHELGHFLGLLDEYEALSGIFPFYPKTPFEGSEGSRMGLSMKSHTRVMPMHHYLVLRRFHCDEPSSRDPYRDMFAP